MRCEEPKTHFQITFTMQPTIITTGLTEKISHLPLTEFPIPNLNPERKQTERRSLLNPSICATYQNHLSIRHVFHHSVLMAICLKLVMLDLGETNPEDNNTPIPQSCLLFCRESSKDGFESYENSRLDILEMDGIKGLDLKAKNTNPICFLPFFQVSMAAWN